MAPSCVEPADAMLPVPGGAELDMTTLLPPEEAMLILPPPWELAATELPAATVDPVMMEPTGIINYPPLRGN